MLGAQIRPDEKRATLAAFGTLLAFMAGHSCLETARDALFLAKIPAQRLPFVYIGVALAALTLATLQEKGTRRQSARSLASWLVLSALGTLAFWPLLRAGGSALLYALYIWSATVSTLVLARFWILLGDYFTVTQAKRLYTGIGVGSVLGAIAGSGMATLIAALLPAESLLWCAALALGVSALGPPLFVHFAKQLADQEKTAKNRVAFSQTRPRPTRTREQTRLINVPYARRVGVLVLVSTLAVTLVDYLFKSSVAAQVPRNELGEYFGRVYLGLNLLSLLVQLSLVRPLLRALGVNAVLTVLPLLLLGGAGFALAGGGLAAALLLKGADGSLRYSLHRTAIELLYLPMNERMRHVAKTTFDILAQRGGQALASLVILGLVAIGGGPRFLIFAVMGLAMVWVVGAYELRSHYFELFRATLRASAQRPAEDLPELSLSSLESVMVTLNSQNDNAVRAALEYLEHEDKSHLIPSLILYHPSPAVVLAALEILHRSKRRDFLPILERLLDAPQPELRAAALRALTELDPDRERIHRYKSSPCPELSATALVCLIAHDWADDDDRRRFEELANTGSDEARAALGRAIAHRPRPEFEDTLITLARAKSSDVQRGALEAMARAPNARYLAPLVSMLARRDLRPDARATLVAMGDMALSYLGGALADAERASDVRRHLPRTIMRFQPGKASRILLEQLTEERDGVVRYKILRALGHLLNHEPNLALDAAVLKEACTRTIAAAYRLLDWRVGLEHGIELDFGRDTEASRLLLRLLHDKEVNAIERLFRLLALLHPEENVYAIYRGLASSRANLRSLGRELIENLLESPEREAVLGLIDDGNDASRLEQGAGMYEKSQANYEAVLAELIGSDSQSLASLAVYHAGELGLGQLRERMEQLSPAPESALSTVLRGVMQAFEAPRKPSPA